MMDDVNLITMFKLSLCAVSVCIVECSSKSDFEKVSLFSASSYNDQVKYMRRCVELAKEAVRYGESPVRFFFCAFSRFLFFNTHNILLMNQYSVWCADCRSKE